MSRFGDIRGPARREPWGTAVEVSDGLFRIRLNNPVGLLLVNTYAYRTATDLVIVDPGWPWTLEALETALRDLGLASSLADVTAWLYTHTHIDHMGGAALLADYSDAPHYAYRGVEPYLERWHSFQDDLNDWTGWSDQAFDDELSRNRMRATTQKRIDAGVEFLVKPHGERKVHNAVLFDFGDVLELADLRLRVLDARGHDPMHAAFFEAERGWLFGGDVVIATVTPISRAMDDNLDTYLGSLERLAALDVELLLPGHGVQRSGDLTTMFERSRTYHETLRTTLEQVLSDAGEPLGLFALGILTVPGGKPLEPGGRWAVHLALVDTHVHELIRAGRVEKVGGPRYLMI